MDKKLIRSPFFYVGDKYKLMPQLKKLFPDFISVYAEPFVGGGSSFLNINAERYMLNDINYYVIQMHRNISSYAEKSEELFDILFSIIDEYGLSCSYKNITVPEEIRQRYIKTYYSHYNKDAYLHLRNDFNDSNDCMKLYILLIYGFNHMIRFNSSGAFNLPVGNVDFNKNVYNALKSYLDFIARHDINFYNMDFEEFLDMLVLDANSFVYCDPPYLISESEYNKHWSIEKDRNICSHLDVLNSRGIRFGITNLISHKGRFNNYFFEWSRKYYTYEISSNYISFHDNTVKKDSREVYVTNYGKG